MSLCAMSRMLREKFLLVRTNLFRLVYHKRLLLSEGERPHGPRKEYSRCRRWVSVMTEMLFNNKLQYLQQSFCSVCVCVQCVTPGVRF